MNLDAFVERAARKEYGCGMSRFQAETEAAQEQGYARWQVMNELRRTNFEQAPHLCPEAFGDSADHLPGVQPDPEEQGRPVPERDFQT